MADQQAKLWDTNDVATFLKKSPRTIERMRTDGSGPAYVYIGRTVRYIPGTVRQWTLAQANQTREDKA